MHLLLDAKLLFLVAFLLLVIITNLVKGYRIHKPRNEPFSLADFVIYSKNRSSEFFGVTKNVYIAFCIFAGFFTIVGVNAFMEEARDTSVVVQGVVGDGIQTVDDGLDALKAQNLKIENDILEIKNNKQDIIQEIRNERKKATGNSRTSTSVNEPEEDAIPFKIMTSAPLSDTDNVIIEQDDSLYSQERKRDVITPSSQ